MFKHTQNPVVGAGVCLSGICTESYTALSVPQKQAKSTGLVDKKCKQISFFYCFVSCEVEQLVLPVKLPNGLQMSVCYTILFSMRPRFSSG